MEVFPRRVFKPAFVEVVAAELDGRVGHNADTIGAVATHEASPPFLSPHFAQCFAHSELVVFTTVGLDLKEDLEALEW